MKVVFQVLVPSILHATYAAGNRCVELNSQATALQSGDSCTLLRTVISGGDILAGDTSNMIDATCGFHLEDVYHPTCVEEVMGVVAGITDEGCEVTGGITVADFINTVVDSHEGFALLTRLACKQVGECFADIQKAVEFCKENPTEEDCMDYVTCDCLTDLLSVIETLSDDGKKDFLKLDLAIIESIQIAGTTCRCEDLNYRALSLELSPSCAFAGKIVQDGDILAGDATVIADTCDATTDTTCVEDVVVVVDGIIEYGCEVTDANPDFIYALKYSSDDFKTTTDFACTNDCYTALSTCQNNPTCLKSLSCECKGDFLTIVEGLTPDSEEDLLKLNTSTIDEMQMAVGECNCDKLNAKGASLQTEGYCALHNSIVKEGYMFAGDSTDIQSTCSEQMSCVGNVTEVVVQIIDQGCEIQQNTNMLGTFLYTLNNNSEWKEMTNFICNSGKDVLLDPSDGCYEEIKVVVEECGADAMDICTESARSDCLDSFMDMVDRLSDDAKDDLLGIDAATLSRIKSWKGIKNATTSSIIEDQPKIENATSPTTPNESQLMIEKETSSSDETQPKIENETSSSDENQPTTDIQPAGGAFPVESLTAIIYVAGISYLLL